MLTSTGGISLLTVHDVETSPKTSRSRLLSCSGYASVLSANAAPEGRSAFDHPEWIYELKYDGFRALAYIEAGECRLISRNGNQFNFHLGTMKRLATKIAGYLYDLLPAEFLIVSDGGAPSNFHLRSSGVPAIGETLLLIEWTKSRANR